MSLKDKLVNFSYVNNTLSKEHVQSERDLGFMNSVSAAILLKSTFKTRLMLWVGFASVIWLIIWAYFAEIDQLTRGQGKVIPSHQMQVIQNLEGGIVSELLVREGDIVKKGQTLLRIDATGFTSSFEENELRYQELQARTVRLNAEAYSEAFKVDKALVKSIPQQIKNEKSLYLSNQKQLKNSITIYQRQLRQRQNELIETRAKKKQLQTNFDLISKEIAISEPLVKEGIVSRIELLQLQRQAGSVEGELKAATLSIPRLRSVIEESKNRVTDVRLAFQNKSKEELNEVVAEMARIKKTNVARKDKVSRTLVRSPVAGTINRLLINTVGGVVKPGMDIVEIVPIEDTILIEAQIRPADIAFLHPGQKVIVKFAAYDFAIYGSLQGVLTHISADTIVDEIDRQHYYLVHVKTDKNFLGNYNDRLQIIIGMTADVDVVTGKKTVLDYILKPILRAKQNALSER